MPSRNLEETIHHAIDHAIERRHEFVTLEHLLLALAKDEDAVDVLCACDVDLDKLREDIVGYLDNDLVYLVSESKVDPQPTEGFNRTLQRAVIHVQSSGREEVTGANVLVAIFSERESHAVYFLQGQDMTRFDAVNYISHGVAKVPGLSVTRGGNDDDDDDAEPFQRSRGLDDAIHRAKSFAVERRHDLVTLEHLLLALTEDPDAVAMLRASKVDLKKLDQDVTNYLDKHLDHLVGDSASDLCLSAAFNNILRQAASVVRSTDYDEVTGAHIVAAVFSERECQAVYFLKESNLSESDVAGYFAAMRGSDESS